MITRLLARMSNAISTRMIEDSLYHLTGQTCYAVITLIFNVIARGVKTIAAVCRFVYRIWLMADWVLSILQVKHYDLNQCHASAISSAPAFTPLMPTSAVVNTVFKPVSTLPVTSLIPASVISPWRKQA